jgi:hypothetical protein
MNATREQYKQVATSSTTNYHYICKCCPSSFHIIHNSHTQYQSHLYVVLYKGQIFISQNNSQFNLTQVAQHIEHAIHHNDLLHGSNILRNVNFKKHPPQLRLWISPRRHARKRYAYFLIFLFFFRVMPHAYK